jgi:predicted nucleic acid-binding protein
MIYADTSFLAAAYIVDAHTPAVLGRLANRPGVFITPFNRGETASAIFRQQFLGKLTLAETIRAWKTFEGDSASGIWRSVAFPDAAWERCADLARSYGPSLGVRTLDSLHVACALELRAEKFWTFDDRQSRLAEAVGLDTKA